MHQCQFTADPDLQSTLALSVNKHTYFPFMYECVCYSYCRSMLIAWPLPLSSKCHYSRSLLKCALCWTTWFCQERESQWLVCVCVCACVAWTPIFQRPIFLISPSGLRDYKVARVGRPATDYKIVVIPWESGIWLQCICISCHFLTVWQLVCVWVWVWVCHVHLVHHVWSMHMWAALRVCTLVLDLLQLLDEVRLVGTHKMGINLAADKVGEVVIILRDLPTRELLIISTESTCAQMVQCT